MYIDNIEKIRKLNFFEIRSTYRHLFITAEKDLLINPNDHYRVDRSDVLNYFDISSKFKQKIKDFVLKLKEAGKVFSSVDICGRASGKHFGVSKSYLFSLKTNDVIRIFREENDVFIDGNIFNPNDFYNLIKEIKKMGIKPAFVTFMPMAGLQSFTPSSKDKNREVIIYMILAKRLEKIIEVLLPGGFVMIERPFQFDRSMLEAFGGKTQNQFTLSIAMKKISKKLKCKIEILSNTGGPYFLIQKK